MTFFKKQMNCSTSHFGKASAALRSIFAVVCVSVAIGVASAQTPAIGAKAPDFTLQTPTGTPVTLAKERAEGTTVLVLLRGFPGYQCPYCVKQVHDFVEHSADFSAKKTTFYSSILGRRPSLISTPKTSWQSKPIFQLASSSSSIPTTK